MILEKKAKEKNDVKIKGKKNKKRSIFFRIILLLILIISILAGIFIFKWQKNGGGWKGAIKTTLGYDENKNLDKIYCLLLGQSENLTDTIMVASYDPKTQDAALLSIPRDTFVGESKSTASAYDKINSVYSWAGIDELLTDVNKLTGLDIKYYLKIDTKALKVLVDEIGGVYFKVPIDMKYTDKRQGLYIDLKAGYQLLDGDKAEQVVRFRHNSDGSTYPSEYGGEDLGRMKTQRAFLTALLEQTINNMDINTIFNFIDISKEYVKTNLDFNVIKDYVPYILDFNIDDLKTDTLPGTPEYANGVAIYSANEDEVEEVVNKLFHSAILDEINENSVDANTISVNEIAETSKISIEVLNGSGNSSKLTEVVADLKTSGFNVIQTGTTSITNNTTIIDRIDISKNDLEKLQKILGTNSYSSSNSDATADITIIIGTDYYL